MTHLLDYLADRVLLCDGAMGTQVQARDLDVERDFLGHENCTEILCESRPDLVREIHRGYLEAGCRRGPDQQLRRLADHAGRVRHRRQGLRAQPRAAELAREAVAEFADDGRTRFVLRRGRAGHQAALARPYRLSGRSKTRCAIQCAGLVAGGVDAILIETCQDPLQIKAAVNGAKRARAEAGKRHPDLRAGDGRDHRHAAGRRRHRRRRDGRPRARRAGHRPQLRHRPARDGRARQMARRELARA